MDLAAYLDQQLRAAGIPIVGVSLQSTTDRAGWIVQFDAAASDQQKTAAATLLQTIVIDGAALLDSDAKGSLSVVAKALCALMLQVKLNRALTVADAPQVQAMFSDAQKYYKFIVNNGL